jgi:hypothetical protein
MIAAASSDGQIVEEAGDVFRGAIGQRRGAPLGPELAEGLHRRACCCARRASRRRRAILLAELGEDLREVGGMLLLQES